MFFTPSKETSSLFSTALRSRWIRKKRRHNSIRHESSWRSRFVSKPTCRIQWVVKALQKSQAEVCKSHIAAINYKRVFTRSAIASLVVSVVVATLMRKTKKKEKLL